MSHLEYQLDIDGRGSQFASGVYTFHVREGDRYRNQKTENEFTVRDINADTREVDLYYHKRSGKSVSPSGWGGHYVKRVDSLGIIRGVGDSSEPLVQYEPGDDVTVYKLSRRLKEAMSQPEAEK